MSTALGLVTDADKITWNYNHTVTDFCALTGVNVMNSSDGLFKIGVLYEDENSNNAYNSGETIIFCAQVNYNATNYAARLVDYETAFPKALANTIDLYVEGG